MSKPFVITCDIDGVIAGGGYIPPAKRTAEFYATLPLLDPDAPRIINKWGDKYTWCFITGRSFENCDIVTNTWLDEQGINSYDKLIPFIAQSYKGPVAAHLRSTLHIDDDWSAIDSCEARNIPAIYYAQGMTWNTVDALIESAVRKHTG